MKSHGNFHAKNQVPSGYESDSGEYAELGQNNPNRYSTQSESPEDDPGSPIEIRHDPHPDSSTYKKKRKDGGYRYNRMPPSHSNVPADPDNLHGPPIQVAPYYYYTDKDLSFVSGEKEPKRVVTTVDRPSGHNANNAITKRVATSPLKSCIQNAEVKIARGGVAVSFDPWKSDSKGAQKVSFGAFIGFRCIKATPSNKESMKSTMTIF